MTAPPARRALAVGEALIDEHPGGRVVAGAPLHVLAHLSALGWRTALVTRVGDDADGRLLIETMRSFGVGTELVEVDEDLPTGTTTIEMLPGGGHTFAVHGPAAWDAIEGPDPAPECDVAIFGTLALRDPRTASAVTRVASAADWSVVDLNLRTPHFDAATTRWALEHADLVKANAEEEAVTRGLVGVSSLADPGARWVAITRGADGASLYGPGGGEWHQPAPPVEVIDTVGAGDAFLAGLIDGLLLDGDPGAALEAAVRLAADTLGRRGGMPSRPSGV